MDSLEKSATWQCIDFPIRQLRLSYNPDGSFTIQDNTEEIQRRRIRLCTSTPSNDSWAGYKQWVFLDKDSTKPTVLAALTIKKQPTYVRNGSF